MEMYQNQTGAVPGSEKFSIQRGVRQGDVLSPLLFNAVLEDAIRKWKLKLTNEGLRLGHDTRLTNLRYADDLMIFATSREELVSMVEMLVQELSHWIAAEWHEDESIDDLYFTGGIICWNMWDYGCYFARRHDTQISWP